MVSMPKEIIITLDGDTYNIAYQGGVPTIKELSFAWGKLTELFINNVRRAFEGQDATFYEKLKARTYTRFHEIWAGHNVDQPNWGKLDV